MKFKRKRTQDQKLQLQRLTYFLIICGRKKIKKFDLHCIIKLSVQVIRTPSREKAQALTFLLCPCHLVCLSVHSRESLTIAIIPFLKLRWRDKSLSFRIYSRWKSRKVDFPYNTPHLLHTCKQCLIVVFGAPQQQYNLFLRCIL